MMAWDVFLELNWDVFFGTLGPCLPEYVRMMM